MSNLNTDPLCSMRLLPDKPEEFNHSDKEFNEVLEDGLKLNDQVQSLKKQIADLSEEKCKAKEEAKAVIRDLQVLRDSYSVGASGRNIAQQAINFIMMQFAIDMFEVACEFKIAAEDMVNQPPHCKQHATECFDEMVQVFGVEAVKSYCKCAAWKYRYRAPYKGKFEEDNAKADWYLKKLAELASVSENEPDDI